MIFEDTTEEVPTRWRIDVSPELLVALKDSAENGKTKTIVLAADQAELLKRQLRAKKIRDEFDVSVRTKADSDGNVRFVFKATMKDATE